MADEVKKKRSIKPLLVVGTGIALVAMGAAGCGPVGNLMAPRCPEGQQIDNADGQCKPIVTDGGTP